MKPRLFLSVVLLVSTAHAAEPLLVDQRGGTPFRSLKAAAAVAGPGDTIQIAPGSGPYREVLFLPRSGEPGRPITVDGAGETITGFDELRGFQRDGEGWTLNLKPLIDKLARIQGFKKEPAGWVCNNPRVILPAFPGVLTYRGQRLLQDPATGQFTRHATITFPDLKLTLLPGTKPEGWEISARDLAIRIFNASHHLYRNLRASGSLNDGVNLHGQGEDLRFENIEAFHNIDEGFSAHDEICCEIDGGNFWGNDNGIANAPASNMRAVNLRLHANLGWGLSVGAGSIADLSHVRCWANGVSQLLLARGSLVTCHDVTVYQPAWTTKPWLNYQESSGRATMPAFANENASPPGGDPVAIAPPDQAPPATLP